jgi:hypothetical protein
VLWGWGCGAIIYPGWRCTWSSTLGSLGASGAPDWAALRAGA